MPKRLSRWDEHASLATQSGVEVVQDPELSKDDRTLWVAVEAFDLATFEFEHVAARCVHFLTRGGQLAKGKLQRAIVGALQRQLHHDDIAIDIDAIQPSRMLVYQIVAMATVKAGRRKTLI